MIPYMLQFHGIRDYQPTQLTFGDEQEHILITGPNGTGKSTISFCFGAVLNSAKVAVEGLRSNNLPADAPWNAMIQLIFHNTGRTQIDAPRYIAFRINITQPSLHSLVQRQFTISTGNSLDELTEVDLFRSGDPNQRNFKAYEEELRYKYKIFPDAYYLVWYQQEVNQFSTMSPEERFRRFSDMHGIAEIQQRWESFVEQAKEIEEDLRTARAIVTEAKHNLNLAKHAYDSFIQNQKRLQEHGTNHIQASLSLQAAYVTKKEKLLNQQKETTAQMVNLHTKLEQLQKQLSKIDIDLANQENNLTSAQTGLVRKQTLIAETKQQILVIDKELDTVREQLKETDEQRKRLRFTEQETIRRVTETTQTIEQLHEQEQQLLTDKKAFTTEVYTLQQQIAETKWQLESIQKEQAEAEELLAQYDSSHTVIEQINQWQAQARKAFHDETKTVAHIQTLKESIHLLQQNKMYSPRQQAGLTALKQQGIVAYALRDLVETASMKNETLLNPIKYTIFYDDIECQPVNDLYYVSLKHIMPDRLVTTIPALQLNIRAGLTEVQQNHATKVLWWIEQFAMNSPRLKGGILTDVRGKRGAQEAASYILNEHALQRQLEKEQNLLYKKEQLLMGVQTQLVLAQQKIEEYSLILPNLKKAEAQQLETNYVAHHERRLAYYEEQLVTTVQKITEIEQLLSTIVEQRSLLQHERKQLQQELSIYEQLGQLKALQEQQQTLQTQRLHLVTLLETEQKKAYTIEDNIRTSEMKIRQLSAAKQTGQFDIKDNENTLQSIQKHVTQYKEEIEAIEADVTRLAMELDEFEQLVPDIYKQATRLPLLNDSIARLDAITVREKLHFEEARLQKVDPYAESNYLALQQDYEHKKGTVQEAEELLSATTEHARKTEDHLDITINMHVRTVHSLFEQYMEQFNFEGKVEFERFIDNKGRAIFKLYIKVRKIGHRGALEDVSVKARNGRYGKGVSGGEESLSSLLFALALLQNLQTNPNFIMLDEFDSALDDTRKERVFDLYATALNRKLFILSPKAHSDDYYAKFKRAFVIEHNARIPRSSIRSIYQR